MRQRAARACTVPSLISVVASSDSHRALVVVSLAFVLAGIGCVQTNGLPATASEVMEPSSVEEAAIEQREICVGSSVASAGTLGDTLYYRAAQLSDGKLVVGYFAFFSQERPWGNNWLTWTVVPAVAVDMFYSHGLFFGPGVQRAAHGKGDVEGFRIVYDLRPDGTLTVESAVADDGSHDVVRLGAADVMRMDPARPTFYSDVWSHQLGARGVTKHSDLAYVRCFGPGHVRPLPAAIDDEFALGGRAPPAHVEALGGRVIGGPIEAAKASPTGPARPPL
jgi:hypothetical protein